MDRCKKMTYKRFFKWAEQAPSGVEVYVILTEPETIPDTWEVVLDRYGSRQDMLYRIWKKGDVKVSYCQSSGENGLLRWAAAQIDVDGTDDAAHDNLKLGASLAKYS